MQMPTGQCLKALSLFAADCFSVKAEAGRPSCGGRRTVSCFGTALKYRLSQRCSACGQVICAWPPRNVGAVAQTFHSIQAQRTHPEALQRWRTRQFRAVPKQQAVRRPPKDGRPASTLTDKQLAVQSDKAFRHWPTGICIWPNVELSGAQRRRRAARSVRSRPPLGLRLTAGLGRLLTGKVYCRKLAARI